MTEIDPAHAPFVLNQHGALAYAKGDFCKAEIMFKEALRLHPRFPTCWSNLGLVHQQRGEDNLALACYNKALEIDQNHVNALCNLGFLTQEMGYPDNATALFKKVVRIEPDHPMGPSNLCLTHLMRHDFAQGWSIMGKRFNTKPPVAIMRPYNIPLWNGRPTPKLAIWPEQGLGDQILFCSLLPDLVARGQDFVLEVARRLVPVFQRSFPSQTVIGLEESEAGAFNGCTAHIPMGSLGTFLRPNAASFVGKHSPFIVPDPKRTAAYRERLAMYAPRRSVAISWRSFQQPHLLFRERKKSAPLAAFSALGTAPDVMPVSVQYGQYASELIDFVVAGNRCWTPAYADLDKMNDVDGVIALVAACDAVVTTSNVSAHYAGALGKPTYLIYPKANHPCWYWSPGPDGRCLWYPSVRVITHPDVSDWAALVGMAAAEMRKGAEAPFPSGTTG